MAYGIGSIFFGTIMGAIFQINEIKIHYKDKDELRSKINKELSRMDYYLESESNDFFTYRPSFLAGIGAGRISVDISEGEKNVATVIGPKHYVDKLEKKMRA